MAAPSPQPYKAVRSEFTDGPWRGSGMWTIEDAEGETVAVVTGDEEREANALLFSAAPDLLKAANRAHRYLAKCIDLDHLEEDPRDGIAARLAEAIEKAEGERS